MRRCSRCRQAKPDEDFAWRYKAEALREAYCRPCRAEYKQSHYARNKQRYADQARDWKQAAFQERSQLLLTYLASHPCVDCGESDPVVLEFDHLGNKRFDVGEGFWNRAWDAVLKEIKKCDVVCVNCHRRRTARRLPSQRFLALERMQAASRGGQNP